MYIRFLTTLLRIGDVFFSRSSPCRRPNRPFRRGCPPGAGSKRLKGRTTEVGGSRSVRSRGWRELHHLLVGGVRRGGILIHEDEICLYLISQSAMVCINETNIKMCVNAPHSLFQESSDIGRI